MTSPDLETLRRETAELMGWRLSRRWKGNDAYQVWIDSALMLVMRCDAWTPDLDYNQAMGMIVPRMEELGYLFTFKNWRVPRPPDGFLRYHAHFYREEKGPRWSYADDDLRVAICKAALSVPLAALEASK